MENKKVIIFVVLAIVAVISVVRGVMAPPKYKSGAVIPAASVSAGQPASQQAAVQASLQRRARRTTFKTWKRSPFSPASSGTSSGLVLNGIIWSKDRPKAMIGDMIVTKGDNVNGNRVIDIKPDKVILNDGANNFELKMEK